MIIEIDACSFKNYDGKVVARIAFDLIQKKIVKTIGIDKTYIVNGKKLYEVETISSTPETIFLTKYDDNKNGENIMVKYLIFSGVKTYFYLHPNLWQRILLNLSYERYLIQRIKGVRRILIEVGVIILTAFITRLFNCP